VVKKQTRHSSLFAALALAVGSTSVWALSPPVGLPAGSPEDLARFNRWFAGEWNNNEQVWQQKGDSAKLPGGKPEDPIPHTHHIFARVKAPKVGEDVYYIQQYMDNDPAKTYRQRIYRITPDVKERAIRLEIFSLPDEKSWLGAHRTPDRFAELDIKDLRPTPGCDVWWRHDAGTNAYTGTMKPNACSFVSQRYGGKRIIISDTLRLTENEIWINDQARDEAGNHVFGSKTDTPVKNRKVRQFTGWVYIHRDGKAMKEGDKNFSFRRDLALHSEGAIVPVLYEDGSASPYLLELAQLTYQNTKQPILKLALLDKETKKSVTYIWANPDAWRVGMNLGWVQVGLTQVRN
jgi:hypothetical protein